MNQKSTRVENRPTLCKQHKLEKTVQFYIVVEIHLGVLMRANSRPKKQCFNLAR